MVLKSLLSLVFKRSLSNIALTRFYNNKLTLWSTCYTPNRFNGREPFVQARYKLSFTDFKRREIYQSTGETTLAPVTSRRISVPPLCSITCLGWHISNTILKWKAFKGPFFLQERCTPMKRVKQHHVGSYQECGEYGPLKEDKDSFTLSCLILNCCWDELIDNFLFAKRANYDRL